MPDIGLNIKNRLNRSKDLFITFQRLSKKYILYASIKNKYHHFFIKHKQGIVYIMFNKKKEVLEDGYLQEITCIQY